MHKHPVLQSGFIAFTDVGLQLPKFNDPTIGMAVLGKEVYNKLSDYFYSKDVEALVTQWKNDVRIFKSFDFREQVLVAAYRAFGTSSLRQWLELQAHRPTFSRLHEEFLLDTLNHVLFCVPRSVEPLQWVRLLYPATGENVTFNLDQWKEKIDMDPQYESRWGPAFDLRAFLQQWVGQPDGYADLLKTLYVIFGQRRSVPDSVAA